jgi:hypothetical protein
MVQLKLGLVCTVAAAAVGGVSSFSFQPGMGQRTLVNIEEYTGRDVVSMEEWAVNAGGVQRAEGVQFVANLDPISAMQDFEAVTRQDLPAGSPVLFVPEGMIFSGSKAIQEMNLQSAESALAQADLQQEIPLFRVFCKVLLEYSRGEDSPWFPWLNSLPRRYNNGASMTYACFECLPPYAGWLAMKERINFVNFQKAVQFVDGIEPFVKAETNILKWAYNVAATRSIEYAGGQDRLLAPMADYFNHGTYPNVEISFDEQGNCMVYAFDNIPAGSPLRVSLGDPTNPSPLFATYGFLEESSPATFCKLMDMQDDMRELGYDFSNLLFYKDTGDIAMEVYDTVLYSILKKNDPNLAQQFYQVCSQGDADSKNSFHQQYWSYTIDVLRNHVDGTLRDLENLSAKARSKDPRTHPRVPVILKHNEFVKETFQRVKANLDQM